MNALKRLPRILTNQSLFARDHELYSLIELEKKRQKESIELIASENYTSRAVLDCLGSELTNKYSEGLPGKRYYGGNQYVDMIENLCINRLKKAFRLGNDWGINVQSYSGSPANFSVYTGLLKPGDKIMGLDLPSGGHLTHGFKVGDKKISGSSIYFNTKPYVVSSSGYIDYDRLEREAHEFKPNLLICGYSAYPRDLEYERFKKIADDTGAYLMCDMSHFSGFVATEQLANPFNFCDVVTSTTHKTLRGPRAGIIFFKNKFEDKINNAVFPGMQGGPHQNQIAAIATQANEIISSDFKEYIRQVGLNAKALAAELVNLGFNLVTGGTDNHIVMVDLRNFGITGSKMEKVCELVNISINKNSIVGDKSALSPSGIRLGSAAMTTREFTEEDFKKTAQILDSAKDIVIDVQNIAGSKKLADFNVCLNNHEIVERISNLKNVVSSYVSSFPV